MQLTAIHDSFPSMGTIQCKVWRGDILESQHQAYAVLMNDQGDILCQAGDAQLKTCIRSSFKPFQAWASLHQGAIQQYDLSDADIALICASHNGEPKHQQQCLALLNKIGRSIDHLECGAHWPYDEASKQEMLKQSHTMTHIHNNCSGKHCGMLILADALAVDSNHYVDRTHPTQQYILRMLKQTLGFHTLSEIKTGIDGCSLPTPQLTLEQIASLFIRLACARFDLTNTQVDDTLERIFHAMNQNPFYVAGSDRFDTCMMQNFPQQVVSKVGGEAIRGLAIRLSNGAKYAVVIKVLDGNMRALHPATLCFLESIGMLDRSQLSNDLRDFARTPLKNWQNRCTGYITADVV